MSAMKRLLGLAQTASKASWSTAAATVCAATLGVGTIRYLATFKDVPAARKAPTSIPIYDVGSKTLAVPSGGWFSAPASMSKKVNVAVLGASGGIGQPLSLLLKLNPMVSNLHLYDIVNTPGVAADLGHIDTGAKVKAIVGKERLADAVKGVDLVVIPAGVPRKPGMMRDDLFNINASIMRELVIVVADNSPNAWVGVISNPVNSTVPIAAKVLKAKGVYNKAKLLGVTTLDVVRAQTFLAEYTNVEPKDAKVTAVGGHAGQTILPVLSTATPSKPMDADKQAALMKRIQEAGTEVVEAKAGMGSATLSMAYAAVRFADTCMRAMLGEEGIVECAYVESDVVDGLSYFA